jgi:hypothetical protein
MMTGKIVLVPFPFDDLSGSKVRPAICLTDPVGQHRHVVLGFITSQIISINLRFVQISEVEENFGSRIGPKF